MTRFLVVALAIAGSLGLGSVSLAAPVTFDLTGVVGWWSRSTDANASIPGPPTNGGPCVGMSTPSYGGCFRYAFEPGSSLAIDITGNTVTMLGGTLGIHAVTPLVFGTIVLETSFTTTVAPGATGTLDRDVILWATLADYTTEGTINCTGANCGMILHPGVPIPLDPYWNWITDSTPTNALGLGLWVLNAAHDQLVVSTTAFTQRSNAAGVPDPCSAGFTFGSYSFVYGEYPDPIPTTGCPVPEPGPAVLLLLGLGALALHSLDFSRLGKLYGATRTR
ncbi:MAG: hypothetical protein FJ108_17330 [Deltaproteobacteria bacterium]|nr:hypothetical protein [Deltaproteobacteria bacterium]